ncbi:MAG: hypothetical protein WCJ19_02625 [bacterium]
MDINKFVLQLNSNKYKLNEPLSSHTQVKIGGPADIWYEASSTDDFINTIKLVKENNIPVTVIGWGSNILVGDKGIRGLVIKNMSKNIIIAGEVSESQSEIKEIASRWESNITEGTFRGIEFKDLDYDESSEKKIEVTLDSGADLPFAINYTISKGATGLQWYAKIPGTIGGAIFNNIHGGTHFINEVVKSVRVLGQDLEIKTLSKNQIEADYDKSKFHNSGEIIIDAVFELYKGDSQKAAYVASEWAKRKVSQPANSTGSVFANISQEEREHLGYPTTSTGYIIEHILKMTGFRVGDAAICPTSHNFITNEGNATAKDYMAVIKEIQKRAKEQIGIDLITEIFILGEF